MKKTGSNFNREDILSWIWLIGVYCGNVVYQLLRGKVMLDSDMASEMILSDILNKEHSVLGLTKSWCYSTELKFFHMQWLYRIGLVLFPNDWHLARTVAMMLGIAIFVYAVWLVFYAAGIKRIGVFAATLCLMPGGGWYFWQTLYGGYILPYIFISLFSIALIMLSVKNIRSVRSKIYIVIVLFLGFASGMNGVKQLMIFYAPLMLAVSFSLVFEIREKKQLDKTILQSDLFRYWCISLAASVFSAIGYLINSVYLSKIYVFKQYGETKIKGGSFFELLKYYIWSFGYAEDKVLLSIQGIASMCGVLFGLIVVFSGIRLVLRYGRLSGQEKILASIAVSSILFNVFIFSYVGGEIQYFQPLVPMGIILVALEIKTEEFSFDKSRMIVGYLVMFIMLAASIGTVINENDHPIHAYRAQPELYKTVSALVDMGYTQGVAKFWLANVITELSNGKIDMWFPDEDDHTEWRQWLQRQDHIGNSPEGKYFLILKIGEDIPDANEYYLEHPELRYVYSDANYVIYSN